MKNLILSILTISTLLSCSNDDEEDLPPVESRCDLAYEIVDKIPAKIGIYEGGESDISYDGIQTYYSVDSKDLDKHSKSNSKVRIFSAIIDKQDVGTQVEIEGKVFSCLASNYLTNDIKKFLRLEN